jgi:hypothetical protein
MALQRTILWIITLAALALPACAYSKETVPQARSVSEVRVPNQQRLVALAVEEAVESLDFKAIAGKTVSIELTGIFPHSNEDMLDYLVQQVESKLARSGVRVVIAAPTAEPRAVGRETAAPTSAGVAIAAAPVAEPRPGPLAPPPVTPSWLHPGAAKSKPPPAAPPPTGPAPVALPAGHEPDYRLLVGVSWGGIDTRDKVRTDEPLLTEQLSLAVVGVLGGGALIAESNSTFRTVMSANFMLAAVAGSIVWYVKKTPFPHVYTLIGRVRVVARGIPTKEGTAFTTEGSGSSKVIIDERNPEGYRLQ